MKTIRTIAAVLAARDREEMKIIRTIAAVLAIAVLAVTVLAGCRSHMMTIRLINTSVKKTGRWVNTCVD